MKIEKQDSTAVRQILIGMIVDRTVLGRISSKWTGGMFQNSWANLIGSWCIKYFNKYEKAPMKHIDSIFNNWANSSKDKETIKLVEEFLFSLSEEYKELKRESNSDYILDLAGKHFNQVKLLKLTEQIQDDIDGGEVDKADSRILTYSKVEIGFGEGIDVFQDKEAIRKAFESNSEPLIIYSGALGEFFGDHLERDGFVAFTGPEKRGKSLWLEEIAFRAVLQRRKVAYFQAGDMSESQVMRRFMQRVSKRPIKKGKIKYPIRIGEKDDKNIPVVKTEIRKYDDYLDWREARRNCEELMRSKVKSNESYLKLFAYRNTELHVRTIDSALQSKEREGWIPDVVVIDYADNMDMTYYGKEGRDCINETWSKLRSISQRLHCLLVTATQSDTASYSTEIIRQKNFSDDKRKNAHVTGMIGINQSEEEKERGLMRLNWVELREGKYVSNRCVYIAGCPEISNVAIRSCF